MADQQSLDISNSGFVENGGLRYFFHMRLTLLNNDFTLVVTSRLDAIKLDYFVQLSGGGIMISRSDFEEMLSILLKLQNYIMVLQDRDFHSVGKVRKDDFLLWTSSNVTMKVRWGEGTTGFRPRTFEVVEITLGGLMTSPVIKMELNEDLRRSVVQAQQSISNALNEVENKLRRHFPNP